MEIIQKIRDKGVLSLPRFVLKNIRYAIRKYFDTRFDRKYGIKTAGRVELHELPDIDSHNKNHGVLYEPTPIRTFRFLIDSLSIDTGDYTFVDYGSGKGRVVIAAAEMGFGKVIGVEFSKKLCGVAEENIAIYSAKSRAKSPIDIYHLDAADLRLPETPCVLYFFNPFDAVIMQRIIGRILASYADSPRDIYVIYYNPEQAEVFKRAGAFRKINKVNSIFELAGPAKRQFHIYKVDGNIARAQTAAVSGSTSIGDAERVECE